MRRQRTRLMPSPPSSAQMPKPCWSSERTSQRRILRLCSSTGCRTRLRRFSFPSPLRFPARTAFRRNRLLPISQPEGRNCKRCRSWKCPQAPPQLDAAQKAVFDAIVGAVLVAKREPRLLLVHGGPGCG
ncbi:hypothetical protein DIPPA_64459, partial [Diplonema papillatum]